MSASRNLFYSRNPEDRTYVCERDSEVHTQFRPYPPSFRGRYKALGHDWDCSCVCYESMYLPQQPFDLSQRLFHHSNIRGLKKNKMHDAGEIGACLALDPNELACLCRVDNSSSHHPHPHPRHWLMALKERNHIHAEQAHIVLSFLGPALSFA